MSLDFTKITNFSIPQGNVSSFTQEGITFWNKIPTLEEASWEFISEVSRAGKAQEYWYVGDTKTISIGGETYKAIIISFDHYYPWSTFLQSVRKLSLRQSHKLLSL